MVRVDWAQPALEDLQEVYEFIARDSPRYAQLTVEQVTDVAERLAGFPQIGTSSAGISPSYLSADGCRCLPAHLSRRPRAKPDRRHGSHPQQPGLTADP